MTGAFDNMKKITFITVLLFGTLVLAGCQHSQTKVTLAASKNLWNSLPLIAIDKDFFTEEGLDVTVNYLEAGRFCMDAVLSKSADFGDVVDVNVGYLGYSANKNITLIGEISGTLASEIVARKSRGINTPNDLKGKSLAYSPGTTSDVFARRFLEKYGIPETSLTLSKIQPKGMVAAMIAKDGPDASSTWEPFVSAMSKGLGDDMITFEAPEIYTAREYVAVRTDWGKGHMQEVLAFLKALKNANDYALNHRDDAQQIVAK